MKALDRFYAASTQIELDDFFGRDPSGPIEIELTFSGFTSGERTLFASRIHDDSMTVVRVFDTKEGRNTGRYYGMTLRHAPFKVVREVEGAIAQKEAYKALRASEPQLYGDLPNVTKGADVEKSMQEWESNHYQYCQLMRDDGQFFGFTNVARGTLQKATNFVFIPAVRDASADAIDARGAAVARLMELVVRSAIQRRQDMQSWQARISTEYRELTDSTNLPELGEMANGLTATLQQFYAECCVRLEWKPAADFSIPLPTAEVSLEDGGFTAPVSRQGHGLQRAFILALLQHLALATLESDQSEPFISSSGDQLPTVLESLTAVPAEPSLIPGLILAIEEPEAYQHPTKQRHFARVLGLLSDGSLPGVASQTQIVFASHSAHFVSMDRFNEVRIARRHFEPGSEHKQCNLVEASLSEVALRLDAAYGDVPGTRTPEGLRSRLHIITPEVSEGFFADAVVLVEGTSDRAAVKAMAELGDVDLEGLGISIISADGKNNLDRPAAIFASLKIPVYLIWDCDRKTNGTIEGERCNRALQRLMGVEEPEVFAARNHISRNFACFESNLESVLSAELGREAFERHLDSARERFGVDKRDDAQKSPAVMTEVLRGLSQEGLRCETLRTILSEVVALRNVQSRAAVDIV